MFRSFYFTLMLQILPVVILASNFETSPSGGSEDDEKVLPQATTDNAQHNKDSSKTKHVRITDFEKYVKDAIDSGELDRQYRSLPGGQTKPWNYGLLPQNRHKNRYSNVIAYDHTRVTLDKTNDDEFSDYINANYIQGVDGKKRYIATQGPKAETVNDFWRMIWQEEVNYIVMLANVIEDGEKKTEQYWPNTSKFQTYDKITVEHVSSEVFPDFQYRTFLVTHNESEYKRQIMQLHFTSWPDHGVPLYSQSLMPFLSKIFAIQQGTSPIVVHCSAGIGRTGTIILIDLCLRMAAEEGAIDVFKHQAQLREQRVNLVTTSEQYKFVHLVLLQYLNAPEPRMVSDDKFEL